MVAAGLLFLSILPLALGRPSSQSSPLVTRSGPKSVPEGFSPSHTLPPSMFRFVLGLKTDSTALVNSLLDVSDPASSKYGQHLSKEEVDQLTAPQPEAVQAVNSWLQKNGITAENYSSSGDLLAIQIPPAKANTLFNANFTSYVHDKTNTTMVRTLAYSVPADVNEHLSFVYPTTQFIPPPTRNPEVRIATRIPVSTKRKTSKRAAVDPQCAQEISPACLLELYNIPPTPASAPGNSLGVSAFDNEVANKDDLADFLKQARPDITNGTFAVQSVDGGSDNGDGTTEASLDIQYTVGVANNVPTTFITVGPKTQDGALEGFLDIINTLVAQDKPPMVLTTSFGFDEVPFEQAPELAETLCNAYAKLGARGTSVLFASGDGGVSGAQADDSCDGAAFIPTFPATCPYITAVGSTQGISPETAADFSAGGFSNIFARPDYQSDAVDGYLKTLGNTNAGLFNTTGRGYPDVSTQGVQFVIEAAGKLQGVDGTSASSPTFASVIALLNDQLLNAGKTQLGFLNPFLYSKGVAALNDITSGSNPGCGTQGFPAAAGWDAVTGLGTPDFAKLSSVIGGAAGAAGDNSTDVSGSDAGSNSTDTSAGDNSAGSGVDAGSNSTDTSVGVGAGSNSTDASGVDAGSNSTDASGAAAGAGKKGHKGKGKKGKGKAKGAKAAEKSKRLW